MNANEAASERSALFQKVEEMFSAAAEAETAADNRMDVIRSECTHEDKDGKSTIISQSEGLFEYCYGCGKEF
jgi:hypothetical protein